MRSPRPEDAELHPQTPAAVTRYGLRTRCAPAVRGTAAAVSGQQRGRRHQLRYREALAPVRPLGHLLQLLAGHSPACAPPLHGLAPPRWTIHALEASLGVLLSLDFWCGASTPTHSTETCVSPSPAPAWRWRPLPGSAWSSTCAWQSPSGTASAPQPPRVRAARVPSTGLLTAAC